jgi:hypothetical protein
LERPENALSVNEYREMLKQKNQALGSKPRNVVKANETDAVPQTRDESRFILGAGEAQKKKEAKPKKQEGGAKELIVDIKTDDGYYGGRDNRQYGKGKKDGRFNYNPEDFPEL